MELHQENGKKNSCANIKQNKKSEGNVYKTNDNV